MTRRSAAQAGGEGAAPPQDRLGEVLHLLRAVALLSGLVLALGWLMA